MSALRATDNDAEAGGVSERGRTHGVADKLEAGLVYVNQGAERFVGAFILGA